MATGKQTYRLEVSLQVSDTHRDRLVKTARKWCKGRVSRINDDGSEEPVSPEELVETVEDAIMELIQIHPAIEEAGVELTQLCCSASAPQPDIVLSGEDGSSYDATENDASKDDLNEYETGVYLCRWPNGTCSVVTASSRREAIRLLDEWGGAHPSYVYPIEGFAADFCLNDEGRIELQELGEATSSDLWDRCFPDLQELLADDRLYRKSGQLTTNGRRRILEAVQHERNRLWDNQPRDEASTEIGRHVAEQLGTSGVLADEYVKRGATALLKRMPDKKTKPN